MHKHDQRCTDLVEVTANALSGGVVVLMLMAVQRDNLKLSVTKAVEWLVLTYSEIAMRVYSSITGPMVFFRAGVGVQKA